MSDDFPQPNKELEAERPIELHAEQTQQLDVVADTQAVEANEAQREADSPIEHAEPISAGHKFPAEVSAEAIDTNDDDVDPFGDTPDLDDDELDDEDEDEEDDELEEEEDDDEEFDDDLDEDDDEDEDDAPYDLDADDEDESFRASEFGDQEDGASTKPKRRRGVAADGSSKVVAGESNLTDDGDNDPSPRSRHKRNPDSPVAQFEPQRLAKILAATGLDARRKCEEYVTAGRVTVDGEVITDLAFRADPYSQKVALDGERIKLQRKVYFILNKPRGVVCSNKDPEGRPRIIDMFPEFFKERMFTIGRLDAESEGLILVTNDGELANRMAHPRYRVPKFYICHVKGVPSSDTLAALKRGMYFDDGKFSVEGVRLKKTMGDSAYLDIVLNEGQNREIRRLLAKVDHKVMRLKRVGFGPIRLGDMPAGSFRPLTVEEFKLLKSLSEQRAHLDKSASRGRKPRTARPEFPSKRPYGAKLVYGQSGFVPKAEFPVKRSYSDKVLARQISTSRGSEAANVPGSNMRQDDRGSRRPVSGSRPVSESQGGSYGQRPPRGERPVFNDRPPQRRLVEASENDEVMPAPNAPSESRFDNRPPRRDDNRPGQRFERLPAQNNQADDDGRVFDTDADFPPLPPRRSDNRPQQSNYTQRPQSGNDRPPRRDYSSNRGESSQSEGEFAPQRGYGSRPPQGGYNRRPESGEGRPPRRYSSDTSGESFSSQGESGPRRYDNRPPQGGSGQRPQSGYSQRPQYGNDRPPRRDQTDQVESFDNDSDFNGGRRRGNTEDQESTNTPRPRGQRPPQRTGDDSQRPPRGQYRSNDDRPPQRRYGSQAGTGGGYTNQGGSDSGQRRYGSQGGNTGERSGGYSGQRRPAGNRGDDQGGYQSGPPRGRARPPARAPRPTTADGREILEGRVTGYRTPPKEGVPRRPYKAVLGMKGTREQRQQRRKK